MDSTNEGLKKAPHLLVRDRDKEEDRYPEINRKTKTKQTRQVFYNHLYPLLYKWFFVRHLIFAIFVLPMIVSVLFECLNA